MSRPSVNNRANLLQVTARELVMGHYHGRVTKLVTDHYHGRTVAAAAAAAATPGRAAAPRSHARPNQSLINL